MISARWREISLLGLVEPLSPEELEASLFPVELGVSVASAGKMQNDVLFCPKGGGLVSVWGVLVSVEGFVECGGFW